MLLAFNTDRALARLAADAAHIERVAGVDDRPWSRSSEPDRGCPPDAPAPPARSPQERREAVATAIEIAVIGDPDRIGDVLTDDAQGWSPVFAFASPAEAITALRDRGPVFEVLDFRITRLLWTGASAAAEWHAEVVPVAPFLVGDDVLVDARDHRVTLSGASVADLRGDRISAIHTYFDDAALIEQLLLGR
jgi:hypothetical protein